MATFVRIWATFYSNIWSHFVRLKLNSTRNSFIVGRTGRTAKTFLSFLFLLSFLFMVNFDIAN